MAQYINENFDRFSSGRDLKENNLKENPVPKNTDSWKILDNSLAKIVEGRQEPLTDKDLETVQPKTRDILSPMCRLWTITEKTTRDEKSEEKEELVSFEDIIRLIE